MYVNALGWPTSARIIHLVQPPGGNWIELLWTQFSTNEKNWSQKCCTHAMDHRTPSFTTTFHVRREFLQLFCIRVRRIVAVKCPVIFDNQLIFSPSVTYWSAFNIITFDGKKISNPSSPEILQFKSTKNVPLLIEWVMWGELWPLPFQA